MSTSAFRRIPRVSAADAIRREVVELIESGELAVGQKLPTETELADAFGVSRPVVREALGGLRASGVIESQRGRGSYVASSQARSLLLLGRYSIDDLYEVRCHLEIPGAEQAAVRRTDEHVARLLELVDHLEAEHDPQEWVVLDAAFHVAVAKATENEVQLRLVEDLRDLLVEHSLSVALVPGRVAEANTEHRRIYQAIAAGDAVAARDAMRLHLDTVRQTPHRRPPRTDRLAKRLRKGAA